MSEILDTLIRQHESIRDPEDYFRGTLPLSLELPANVLVFNRTYGIKGTFHTCNLFKRSTPFRGSNVHYRYLLIINLKGEGFVVLNGTRYLVNPGNFILVFPHQYHHFLHLEKKISWLFVTFELSESGPLEHLRNRPLPFPPHCWKLLQLLTTDYSSADLKSKALSNRTILLAGLILNEIMESGRHKTAVSVETTSVPQEMSVIDKVNQYIYSRIHTSLTVKELARHAGYSESHLRAVFRKFMGINISSYIREIKINKSRELLHSSGMNVSEISAACGYNSVYAFSHAFKQVMGISPMELRKMPGAGGNSA
jgi:AraC-like DNA-binding protein